MFRFNNPDALLVLLLTLAAWALTRALERGGARWLALAAAFVGVGFITKMLQAFVVVPVFVLVYLVAAPIVAAAPPLAPPAGRRRAARLGRLVGRHRRALAGGQPPVHRRLADTTASWS